MTVFIQPLWVSSKATFILRKIRKIIDIMNYMASVQS